MMCQGWFLFFRGKLIPKQHCQHRPFYIIRFISCKSHFRMAALRRHSPMAMRSRPIRGQPRPKVFCLSAHRPGRSPRPLTGLQSMRPSAFPVVQLVAGVWWAGGIGVFSWRGLPVCFLQSYANILESGWLLVSFLMIGWRIHHKSTLASANAKVISLLRSVLGQLRPTRVCGFVLRSCLSACREHEDTFGKRGFKRSMVMWHTPIVSRTK